MYLFWSMTPQSKDALERYFVRDITQTQVFNFRLCSGHIGLQEVFPRNESNGKVTRAIKITVAATFMKRNNSTKI